MQININLRQGLIRKCQTSYINRFREGAMADPCRIRNCLGSKDDKLRTIQYNTVVWFFGEQEGWQKEGQA